MPPSTSGRRSTPTARQDGDDRGQAARPPRWHRRPSGLPASGHHEPGASPPGRYQSGGSHTAVNGRRARASTVVALTRDPDGFIDGGVAADQETGQEWAIAVHVVINAAVKKSNETAAKDRTGGRAVAFIGLSRKRGTGADHHVCGIAPHQCAEYCRPRGCVSSRVPAGRAQAEAAHPGALADGARLLQRLPVVETVLRRARTCDDDSLAGRSLIWPLPT